MTEPTLTDLLKEENWLAWRSLTPADPLYQTEMITTEDTRREFVEGSRLLRLDQRRRGGDGGSGPSPIQLAIADTLNAGYKFNGVLEPRRTTKTTSIQAVILGRCALRDDYQAGWTLAKRDGGQKAGERFRKDIVTHLERLYPEKGDRPFIVNTSNGKEHIRWPNGSFFNVYAPGNDGFTSGAYDFAWIDEAQDASPELASDLLTSIPPTLDGRFKPQMVASGTAGEFREGNLLWKMLTMEGAGVIRHGIPDDVDPEELRSWEPTDEAPKGRVRELIELSHPGIGFNTPLSDVEDNFKVMSGKNFATEYLGSFGLEGSNTALIRQPLWLASALPIAAAGNEPPQPFALSAFVHPDAAWASIAAAWHGDDGRVHGLLLHHQEGVTGFGRKLAELSRKFKRPITFDSGSNATEVEMRQLRELRPAPLERPLLTRDIGRASVHLMNLITQDKFRHYDQVEMNSAAEIAVKRSFGQQGGWAFGRPDVKNKPEQDITPIEALSLAVYVLDQERISSAPAIEFF